MLDGFMGDISSLLFVIMYVGTGPPVGHGRGVH